MGQAPPRMAELLRSVEWNHKAVDINRLDTASSASADIG